MRKIFPPFARFRHFPVWTQATITLGSAAILVAVWSACGGVGPPRPPALSTPRTELRGRFGAVHALAFSPSGEWVAAGTADKEARLWDVAKGNVIRTMKGHRDAVTSVAVTADGKCSPPAAPTKP